MKAGSFIVGLILVFGAVGAPEPSSVTQICITAVIGLGLMAFSVRGMRKAYHKTYFHESL